MLKTKYEISHESCVTGISHSGYFVSSEHAGNVWVKPLTSTKALVQSNQNFTAVMLHLLHMSNVSKGK